MAHWSARDVVGTGAVIGSILALGYALSGIPNVELVTLTSFVGGWLLGPFRGALAGGTGMFLFSLFNPLGPALPPVHAAQTAGMALAGVAGGWTRSAVFSSVHTRQRFFGDRVPTRFAPLLLGGLGALITLIYDAATNAGHAVAMDLVSQLPQVVLAGIAFTAVHIGANAAIFAILGPPALFVVEKRRGS